MLLGLEQLERDQATREGRVRPAIKSDKANRLVREEFCMFEYVEEFVMLKFSALVLWKRAFEGQRPQ